MTRHIAISIGAVLSFLLWPTPASLAVELVPMTQAVAKDGARVEVLSVGKLPFNRLCELRVRIAGGKTATRSVEGVKFDAIMPTHNHGMVVKPKVAAVGENEFQVSGVKLHMKGQWEAVVTILRPGNIEPEVVRAPFEIDQTGLLGIEKTTSAAPPAKIEDPQNSTPPMLWGLSDFSLKDQSGKPFTLKEMRGKVWIVNFMFTSCSGPCPLLTQKMAGLVSRLADEPRDAVGFLSISTDPATDTPKVLREYARRFKADTGIWKFATGESQEISRLLNKGFKVGVGDDPASHSTRFVVVDRAGTVRATFDLSEEGRSKEAESIVRQLIRQSNI